jgi:hypothetical protein
MQGILEMLEVLMYVNVLLTYHKLSRSYRVRVDKAANLAHKDILDRSAKFVGLGQMNPISFELALSMVTMNFEGA